MTAAEYLVSNGEAIRRAVEAGAPDDQIVEVLRVSGRTVQRWRKRLGLPRNVQIRPVRPVPHGTVRGYRRGCRCGTCADAMRYDGDKYRLARIGLTPPSHGRSGYKNWGCRCDTCKAAGAVVNQAYYRKRLALDVTP